MKNLANILSRGNLTAREKFLLLIQNDIHKAKTGKAILTAADKDALENWKAKDNYEAREWNRLNDGWKYTGRIDIEGEFIYKDAQVAYLSQLPITLKLLSYPIDSRMVGSIKTLKRLKKVTMEEASKIANMQKAVKLRDGMDFDYAVYQLAFERLKPEDRKSLKELYDDVEADHQYLDQEEIIANLYNGKKELSPEAKEKLSELVAEWGYNKFAKRYQLYHYFACIPLLEVARYFLKNHDIEIKRKPLAKNQEADEEDESTCDEVTEAIETYAKEHKTTIQKMLKEAFLQELDELLERYTPLVISGSAELLQRWLSSKTEAARLLQKYIDSEELKIRTHTNEETLKDKLYSKGLYDSELEATKKVLENIGIDIPAEGGELDEKKTFEKFDGAIITGESLYAFKRSYSFAKEFKERVDKYEPNLGIVYADDDPEQKGDHLDQELLVCGLDGRGEASFFSLYGMSMTMLDNLIEANSFFEEVWEGDKMILKFKNPEMEGLFITRQVELTDNYAKLLAFEGILKRVAKIYETDLTYHIAERVKVVREYLEYNNEAIRKATNTDAKSKKDKLGLFKRKGTSRMQEGMIIDIDSIKPDLKSIEEHESKLKEILGDF